MAKRSSDVHQGNAQTPHAIALSIAGAMRYFGSGELASLRRLTPDAAAPAYWRLAARHSVLQTKRQTWAPIVQSLALLTPKSAPEERADIHDPNRRLGTALCDGGHAQWPVESASSPSPMLSEQRLAQLLAARGTQRTVGLLRAIRMLAANRDPRVGIDVGDLAWCFVDTDPKRLAAPYYQRLDRAERAAVATTEDQGTVDG